MQAFPDLAAVEAGLERDAVPYMAELNALTDARATAWFDHPTYGGAPEIAGLGPDFPALYRPAM
jgi:tagatose 1,6-diphosphate aldolase